MCSKISERSKLQLEDDAEGRILEIAATNNISDFFCPFIGDYW